MTVVGFASKYLAYSGALSTVKKAKSRDSGDSRCRVRVKGGNRSLATLPEIPISIIGTIKLLRWYTEDRPQ